MLISYIYDYNDAYIAAKGTIDLFAATGNKHDNAEKDVAFNDSAPFRS